MSIVASAPPLLKVLSLRALHGANIWAGVPVLQLEMEVADAGFASWEALDGLLRFRGIVGAGATAPDPAPGDRLLRWFAEAVVQLQSAGQTLVAFHCAERVSATGLVRLAIEFAEEPIGRAAVDLALRWLAAVAAGGQLDLETEWESFLDYCYDVRIGNSTGPIVEAAAALGIPHLRLDSESLVQLGHGIRQRRIRRAATDRTGMIANHVSTDKELTKSVLIEIGVPVPRGRAVKDADDAVAAAREVGWPVVVKPQDADYGNGVTMRILSEDAVRLAYAAAREHSEGVLVEHHVDGHLFRLLVVAGRLVAAVRREPWFVVGDGRQTIFELIETANFDPRRGPDYVSPILLRARETGEMPVLTRDGRKHDSVPAPGETVVLRHDVYLKCGGIHLDQADTVHPEIAVLAADAAAGVGLDIAGLDVIALDLAKSPAEQDFVVLEVNSEPAINLHLEPLCVPSRPVGEAIVRSLFDSPESSRIPVTVVLGGTADLAVAHEIARRLSATAATVGLASRGGVWLQERPLGEPCGSVVRHVRRLWRHPRTEAVVIHLTLDDVLDEGLPFDRCDEWIECGAGAGAGTWGAGKGYPEGDGPRALECVRSAAVRRSGTGGS